MIIKLTQAEYANAMQRAHDIDRKRGLTVGDRVYHIKDPLLNLSLMKIDGDMGIVIKDGVFMRRPLRELVSLVTLSSCLAMAEMQKYTMRKKRTKGAMFIFEF